MNTLNNIKLTGNDQFLSSGENELKLFTPVQIGAITLSHRIVHAPMTRLRSDKNDAPTDIMVEYYGQRASEGGLLIAEAPAVSLNGRGYLGAPGIYDDIQIPGWKKVAEAVHSKGGKIFMQLFHAGRQSHIDMTGGTSPVGPSDVPFQGMAFTPSGWVHTSPNRALTIPEIHDLINDFRSAAVRAKEAGFDGVELHSANGYLPDEFLQDNSNLRTDEYGRSVENRARFMLEITAAIVEVWDGDRVGVRISPSGQRGGMADSKPEITFAYVAEQLNQFNLAYLHIIEPRIKGDDTLIADQEPIASVALRKIYKGIIIAAGGFDRLGAEAILQKGNADLVAFGRFFASNPDLPYRLKYNLPLAHYNRDAFWGGDESGYTDYPTYKI